MNMMCKFDTEKLLPYEIQIIPTAFQNISNPSGLFNALFQAQGYRKYVPSELANIKSSTWVDDGESCTETNVIVYTAEELAQQESDKQAQYILLKKAAFTNYIPLAVQLKGLLRKIYPLNPTPETDTNLTYEGITTYLASQIFDSQVSMEVKMDLLASGILLKELFTKLATWNLEWNGGNLLETWTLPWDFVP